MSNKDPEEITKIEDLPNVDRSEDHEEEFFDLEAMAQNLGIEDELGDEKKEDEDELPPTFDNTNSFSTQNIGSLEEDTLTDHDHFESSFSKESEDYLEEMDNLTEDDSFNDQEMSEGHFDTSHDEDEFSSFADEIDFTSTSLEVPQEESNNIEELSQSSEIDDQLLDDFDKELHTTPKLTDHSPPDTKSEDSHTNQEEENQKWKRPEDFNEVNQFVENLSYGDMSSDANPPYSVIIKNLKYQEDIEDICNVLIENNFLPKDKEEEIRQSISRGQILIPRISEFAAIMLAHKIRQYDVELLVGLTEEVHPPKNYQSNDKGLSSKASLLRNKKIFHSIKKQIEDDSIITSTLPYIDNYQILKHMGIITHTKLLDLSELETQIEEKIINELIPVKFKETLQEKQIISANQLASQSMTTTDVDFTQPISHLKRKSLDHLYSELVEEMKLKINEPTVNGIIGINFSITPINIDQYLSRGPKYQIVCSGNMVCLERI